MTGPSLAAAGPTAALVPGAVSAGAGPAGVVRVGAGGWTVVEVGGGEFGFSAAHAGLHGGLFEPLHGHTFGVTLRLSGTPDPVAGMLVDFAVVKAALRAAIGPLRRRTLMPAEAPGVTVRVADGRVVACDGRKRYDLPAEDVTLLPLANTTTEEIAGWLLGRVLPSLCEVAGLRRVELAVSEAPDTTAAATVDLAPGTP